MSETIHAEPVEARVQAEGEGGGVEGDGPERGEPERGEPERGEPDGGRDGRGRFAVGNPGGPGNPYARQVAALRKAMLAAVGVEDVTAIIQALVARAKEGNVQAAKLVLAYALGKPDKAADPDRLDAHEWEVQKETATMMPELAGVAKAPPAEMALRTARVLRPLMGSLVENQMADMFLHPEKYVEERTEMELVEEAGQPGSVGAEGRREAGPSVNGVFDWLEHGNGFGGRVGAAMARSANGKNGRRKGKKRRGRKR